MPDVAHQIGPCGWPAGICDDNYGFVGDDAEEKAAAAEAEAVFILWSYTGQRYGLCEVTLEPPPVCKCKMLWCSCRGCTIYLPAPAHEVLEVRVNGEVFNDWVQRGNYLLTDRFWPRDVSITYTRGIPVPAGGGRVVSELAREIALATCDPGKCRIPLNLTQRVRQGDTVTLGPIPEGKIGIPLIDLWISAANGVRRAGTVWTPDYEPQLIVQGGAGNGSPA